jgi:RNA polymerase sigma-70 factor
MASPPELTRSCLLARVYHDGFAVHGDIDLQPKHFAERLGVLIEVHLGSEASTASALDFLATLYTDDLYLSVACAQTSNAAWQRFLTLYENRIRDFARFASLNRNAALDLADSVIADLFLPDASGKSRIASYDGRWLLITWLHAVVNHQAINQHNLKRNGLERMDSIPDVSDSGAVRRINASLIANRYEAAINDSFETASASLTEHERSMLLLRYDEALQVREIASLLAVHPSTVTRQIQQIQTKLQKRVIRVLALKHKFGPAVIKECLIDILENPSHSLLTVLKAC